MKEDIKDAAMNFITGLPLSYEFTVIMVVINRLSKYSRFLALKSDFTSEAVAKTLRNYKSIDLL
jgi:hypothetical protein